MAAPDRQRESGEESLPLMDIDVWLRESPAWLLSAVVHIAILIALGLWLTAFSVEEPLLLEAVYSEEVGEQLIEEPLLLEEMDMEVDNQALSTTPLPPVSEPLQMPEMMPLSPAGPLMAADRPSMAVGVALSGREPGMRDALRKAYGGTEATEAAVMAGLEWLARNQKKSGEWSLKGPYRGGADVENEESATAMALLAFQGRGYTHRSDPADKFTKVVQRGWRRLLRSQNDDGSFFQPGANHHRFYTEAQCAIALCELFAMTRDEDYRDPAQLSIDYLCSTQAPQGGWKYDVGRDSDLSVTGWVMMALQSARMAGLEVPSETIERVKKFLDRVAVNGGSEYGYMIGMGQRTSMTAEGLLCRQYLGWSREDARLQRGVSLILRELPTWRKRNIYYWYYATQVCHHMEGESWRKWNEVTRQVLPENQEKRGRERGSWHPGGDRHGSQGGRLYVTCLSIYTLEVYYRHLPIYARGLLAGE